MVTRSRAWEGRGITIEPEIESRLETEFRQDVGIPAETQVSTSDLCERVFGTTVPSIPATTALPGSHGDISQNTSKLRKHAKSLLPCGFGVLFSDGGRLTTSDLNCILSHVAWNRS